MKLKKKSVVAVLTLSMSMGSVLSMVPVFAETSPLPGCLPAVLPAYAAAAPAPRSPFPAAGWPSSGC